jgi:LytS/YehU family sensor histidine kinase
VPLSREFDFIRHYVTLMQLRYTDKVDICTDLPNEAPDKTVPPLMLISFIENAFKHGISYQHQSYVHIKIAISDEMSANSPSNATRSQREQPTAKSQQLIFTCSNSKAEKPNEEKGGVGLSNVKQRLRLLYDNNYSLKIQNQPDSYNVELIIPLT